MKTLRFVAFLALMGACAPQPEVNYCNAMGTPQGHSEFGKCTQYYFQKQAEFQSERAFCEAEADRTYPKSLCSRPYSYPARFYGGYGYRHGPFGFGHTEMVHVGADYQQIAEVDRLRMTIIAPCMQRRGWNSPDDWTAGRHTPGKVARPQPHPISQKLPWQ